MTVACLMRGEKIDLSLGEQDIKAVNGLRGETSKVADICSSLLAGGGATGADAGLVALPRVVAQQQL